MRPPINDFILKDYPKGHITQWFGENKELYSKAVCYNGVCLQGHNGIDIVAPYGTPIYSVCDGVVVETKNSPTGFGRHVRILSDSAEWTYGHLSDIQCTLGQEVKAGDKIGEMGNSGFVVSGATPYWAVNPYAGTHLHLGKRDVERREPNQAHNVSYSSGHKAEIFNYDNGFFGAVDPAPDFQDTPMADKDIQTLQLTVISLANQVISLLRKIIKLKTVDN